MDLTEAKQNNTIQARHPWELARFRVILLLIQNLLKLNTQNLKILDLGCGDLYICKKLLQIYPYLKIHAVDKNLSGKQIDWLKKSNTSDRLFAYQSIKDFEDINDRAGCDLILLLDIVEHIDGDSIFLQKLSNCNFVNKNTFFLITVPSFSSLFSSHDKFLKHHRRYNNYELKKLVANAGFKIYQSGYFFSSLLIPRIIQALLEKIVGSKNKKHGIGHWKHGKITTNLFKNVLIYDFKLSLILQKIGIKLPGLSNYVICKKSVL
ncbi:MAG: class I SAM-dependent methyltransferase [bacterium]